MNKEFQNGDKLNSDLLKVTKGAAITLSGTITGKLLLFFFILYLAKILQPDEIGLYFLGITIIRFLSILSNFGLEAGLIRYTAIYQERNDVNRQKGIILISVWIASLIGTVLFLSIYFLAEFLAFHIFHKPELSLIIKLLAVSIPFESLMKIFLAVTRGLKLMQYVAYTENLIWVGSRFLITVLLTYVYGLGLKGVILGHVFSSIIAAATAFFCANKLIPLQNNREKPLYEYKKLLKYSIPMLFTTILHDVLSHVDILMLGILVTSFEVGIYGIVARIIAFLQIIFMAFLPIFQPFVSSLHDKKDFESLSNILKVVTQWNLTISLPFCLSFLIFPEFFLNIFGSEFTAGSTCLIILVLSHIFNSVSSLPSSVIFMSGRSDIALKNNLLVLLLNIILNYLLIPKYGIIGAAIATGLSLFFISFVRIIEVYIILKMHPFKKQLWKPLLAGLVSFTTLSIIQKNVNIESSTLIISLLLGLICSYFLFIYIFKLNNEELFIIDSIKKKFLRPAE